MGARVPFTVSHAAAVLPLHRLSRNLLPMSALMIGSMAPDFGNFLALEPNRLVTHSFTGLFTFALPVGLLVWLFYVHVLEKTTITLLGDEWHTRFARSAPTTPALLLRAAIAIVVGAFTHLLWDAITHRGTFATDALPVLLAPTPGMSWLPIYHFLHGLSSVVGLVLLGLWAHGLRRQPARALIRPYHVSDRARMVGWGVLAAGSVIGGLAQWLPYMGARYDQQLFHAAVGSSSGFFVAWCAIALWMWLSTRKR
jgi:hypothetical protein